MAYVKQIFIDGTTKLKASHLNNIEQGIVDNETAISSANAKINQVQSSIPTAVTNAVNEEIYEIIDKLTSPFTSTGSIIQCHPVEGYPLDVSVSLEPIQSGSGDPYPAGGGKNLANYIVPANSYGLTFNAEENGFSVSGTPTITYNKPMFEGAGLKAGVYTLSVRYDGSISDGGINVYIYADIQRSIWKSGTLSDTYSITFELTTDIESFRIHLACDANVTYNVSVTEIQLEAGSTVTPYAPYSNVRPISGHTDCEVVRCGKNLANLTYRNSIPSVNNGLDTAVDGWASDYVYIGSNNVVLSITEVVEDESFYLFLYDENKAFIGYHSAVSKNFTTLWSATIPGHENARYCRLRLSADSNTASRLQLELAPNPTAYEPYHGDTYPVEFGQTVYGGTVDLDAGELAAEWAMAEFNGTEAWTAQANANGGKRYRLSDIIKAVRSAAICSHVPYFGMSAYWGAETGLYNGDDNGFAADFVISSELAGSLDEWKAYLAAQYAAGTPVQIAYKLATPNTIATTTHDIPVLDGTNTVYADAGNVTVNGRIDPNYMNTTVLNRLAALEAAIVSNV